MKLFKIHVEHFSQKDSHESVETFLLAHDDEAVYYWIDKEKEFGCWSDRNHEDGKTDIYNDDCEVIGQETYKQKMIRICGEFYDEDLELDDLYYGKTIYGWELMPQENIGERASILKALGMLQEA